MALATVGVFASRIRGLISFSTDYEGAVREELKA
jgi:hypothetical protein